MYIQVLKCLDLISFSTYAGVISVIGRDIIDGLVSSFRYFDLRRLSVFCSISSKIIFIFQMKNIEKVSESILKLY